MWLNYQYAFLYVLTLNILHVLSKTVSDIAHEPGELHDCDYPSPDRTPYYPDDVDCNCYFVCTDRTDVNTCCPAGLWWDQDSKRCLFPREFGIRKQASCLQLKARKDGCRPLMVEDAKWTVKKDNGITAARARPEVQEETVEENELEEAEDIHAGKEPDVDEEESEEETSKDQLPSGLDLDTYLSRLPNEYVYGQCSVQPNPAQTGLNQFLWGSVDLRQSLYGGKTELRINITGFDISDDVIRHGFHVHEYGDLSQGCMSAGGHYNPFGVVHGGPRDSPQFRHFGDLGNIEEDSDGNVEEEIKDYLVSLLGPFSVLGRAIVIHEIADDLGRGNTEDSLKTGSAGFRLACCTIGLSDGSRWP